MTQLLSDEEILSINQDNSVTSYRAYARAIESAVLDKLKSQEPVKLTQEMMGEMIEEGYGVSTNDWGEHLKFAEEILYRYAYPLPPDEPVLENIEQYRMQMAAICTAALGYWTEGDGILPDYDTPALRDVARLYAKYEATHAAMKEQK